MQVATETNSLSPVLKSLFHSLSTWPSCLLMLIQLTYFSLSFQLNSYSIYKSSFSAFCSYPLTTPPSLHNLTQCHKPSIKVINGLLITTPLQHFIHRTFTGCASKINTGRDKSNIWQWSIIILLQIFDSADITFLPCFTNLYYPYPFSCSALTWVRLLMDPVFIYSQIILMSAGVNDQ